MGAEGKRHRKRGLEEAIKAAKGAKSLHETVRFFLEEGERREKLRKMSPAERRRVKREAARKRTCYHLPVELWEKVKQWASRLDCTYSNVAAFVFRLGIAVMHRGEIDPGQCLRPIANIRWSYGFALSEDGDTREVAPDLPEKLMEEIGKLAGRWECSKSSMAGLLLHAGFEVLENEGLDLSRCRGAINHPRWTFKLIWPEGGLEFLRKSSARG